MRVPGWFISAFVVAACSGSGSGPASAGSASVSGTLLGKTFTPVDAASFISGGMVTVVLYDAPGLCTELVANGIKANSNALVFNLPSAAAGMYSAVNVQFAEYDSTCNSPAGESGSGTVTITSASSISGTYSFFLNADTVTGNFVAPNCAGAPGSAQQTCN
jgi:hypothetical protein